MPSFAMLTAAQRRLLALTSRFGPAWVVAGITGASVIVSDAVTALSLFVAPSDPDLVVYSMGVATVVPLIVAPLCSTAIVRLTTALAAAVDELEIQATTDSLTGLANRRHFFQLAERLLTGGRHDDVFLVAMLDIDHFKTVNDVHGHRAGDEVLAALATNLVRVATAFGGLVARLGGDEFVMLFPVGDGALSRVSTAVEAAGHSIVTPAGLAAGASVGLRVIERGVTIDHAIHLADLALYEAKAARRSRAAR